MLKELFKKHIKKFGDIINIQTVPGGCINEAAKVTTGKGNFFIKWNSASKYPGMFEAEARGLELLRAAGKIYIPKVAFTDIIEETSFLILEWVEPGKRDKDFWSDFGSSLALMHQKTNNKFGLDHDNYIGSLHQSNKRHNTWSGFFIEERLEPQLKLAKNSNKIDNTIIKKFNSLYKELEEIFPSEKPALLHGDLWNGNYMTSPEGKACIFDPSVYYGHREMDIAMARLFGGFDQEFYKAYNEQYPLEKGWQDRLDICNLYPLLVHINLFGGSYLSQVKSILSAY